MSTKRFKCASARLMELTFASLQELYSHVEFLSYNGECLTVAYIA